LPVRVAPEEILLTPLPYTIDAAAIFRLFVRLPAIVLVFRNLLKSQAGQAETKQSKSAP